MLFEWGALITNKRNDYSVELFSNAWRSLSTGNKRHCPGPAEPLLANEMFRAGIRQRC